MITENSNDNKEFIYPKYVLKKGVITKEDETKKIILDIQTWVRKQHDGKWFLHILRISLETYYSEELTETEQNYKNALFEIELINVMNEKAYNILINAEYVPDVNNGDFIITIPLDANQQSEKERLKDIRLVNPMLKKGINGTGE